MFQKNRSTPMKPNYRNIVQKGDEIYLCVNGEWFFYNQTEPPLGAGAMGTVYSVSYTHLTLPTTSRV